MMHSSLENPFDDPAQTLADLGALSCFVGETTLPANETTGEFQDRSQRARCTLMNEIGRLMYRLAAHLRGDTDKWTGRAFYCVSESGEERLEAIEEVSSLICDYLSYARTHDIDLPEVDRGIAVLTGWMASTSGSLARNYKSGDPAKSPEQGGDLRARRAARIAAALGKFRDGAEALDMKEAS